MLRVKLTREGRLFLHVQEESLKSPDVVRFLRALLRHLPGKLLVIRDGAPIHRSKVVKQFLALGAARRIHLERLPAYAPDLNPVEYLWKRVKKAATHLRYFPLFADLIAEVTQTLTQLAGSPDELTSLQGEYRIIKLPTA